ncbi:MAG TPA: hypothetical protein PLV21_09380 [Cyclobacteriaceae bacterium]|nr:hypothetical protein [Cyclobacteriaceae bacterium]HRJ82082.1 hypothetical protein [Cyclobacteriaceae bacterium]
MKLNAVLFFILLLTGCSSKSTEESHSAPDAYDQADSSLSDQEDTAYEKHDDWDYSELYGLYLHEGNMKGFTAYLEILPEGNDLSFSLTLTQNSCTGKAEGSIGMAIHTETEYGGFYDNADCRMEFVFNLGEHTIRIQEVGPCRLHEMSCSFNGTYFKKKG